MANNVNLDLASLVKANPDLRDGVLKTIDEQMAALQAQRDAIAGPGKSAKRGRRSASASGLKHTEAVLKALELAGKEGADSRTIRKIAEEKLNHEFGKSLGTTLNNLCTKEVPPLKWKDNGNRQYTYFAK